jgi:hypothetical protein
MMKKLSVQIETHMNRWNHIAAAVVRALPSGVRGVVWASGPAADAFRSTAPNELRAGARVHPKTRPRAVSAASSARASRLIHPRSQPPAL